MKSDGGKRRGQVRTVQRFALQILTEPREKSLWATFAIATGCLILRFAAIASGISFEKKQQPLFQDTVLFWLENMRGNLFSVDLLAQIF